MALLYCPYHVSNPILQVETEARSINHFPKSSPMLGTEPGGLTADGMKAESHRRARQAPRRVPEEAVEEFTGTGSGAHGLRVLSYLQHVPFLRLTPRAATQEAALNARSQLVWGSHGYAFVPRDEHGVKSPTVASASLKAGGTPWRQNPPWAHRCLPWRLGQSSIAVTSSLSRRMSARQPCFSGPTR